MGYGLLCVALGLGIEYMDNHVPKRDVTKIQGDQLAWTDLEEPRK